ncbi:glnD PII-uridylyltransferase family protein, partial [Vibrio parahaemolyticus VPTS-2010]
ARGLKPFDAKSV